MFGECDTDLEDETGRRECRVATINPKKFPAFSSLLYPLKDYYHNIFMFDMGA